MPADINDLDPVVKQHPTNTNVLVGTPRHGMTRVLLVTRDRPPFAKASGGEPHPPSRGARHHPAATTHENCIFVGPGIAAPLRRGELRPQLERTKFPTARYGTLFRNGNFY